MRRLAWLLWLLWATPALAQIDSAQGYCNLGGTQALLSGMQSTNYQQGIVPGCTVTVYLTGTQSKPTIYADANSDPLSNPFTAVAGTSPNSGYWLFYANTGIGYDICMSGGTAPNNYPQPVCLTDVKIAHSGAGDGTVTNFASGNLSPLFTTSVSNPTTTPVQSFTQISQAAQTAFGNWDGSSAPPFFATISCAGALNCSYNSGSNTFTLTATSAATILKVNGTATTPSSPVNFSSTTPAAPAGAQNCQFQQDGSADVSCWVPGNNLTMTVPPPAAGSYVVVPFTASSAAGSNPGPCQPPSAVAYSTDTSGWAVACGNPFNPEATGVEWSVPVLPSWLPAADVTHIYTVGYAGLSSIGYGGSGTFDCGTESLNPVISVPFVFDATADGFTGSNFGTLNCQINVADSESEPSAGAYTVPYIVNYVYYSGVTAPATGPQVNVVAPLYFNSAGDTLGIVLPFNTAFDTGSSTAYAVSLSGYATTSPLSGDIGLNQFNGANFWFLPLHNSTSTTPTLSLNGWPAATITGPTGGALTNGDLNTAIWAHVIAEPNGKFALQNPQVSPAGGGVASVSNSDSTLTISPTTGAVVASLNLGHANTWTANQTFNGGFDASGATQVKLPVAASYASAANGEVGYDSTNKNWHLWANGADFILAPLASGFTSGHCGQPTSSGGTWTIADAGGSCGISGGGVTSFSGDGSLLNNASSTGAVTATLANAGAHKYWGNNTGSTAAPGYDSVVAADLPVGIFSCTEVWSGSGTSSALTSGDDAISNNTCYNDSGSTRTITAVKCRSDNSSNTTTVNPTFGSAGTGTTILSGALTCGSSYAYSSSGAVSNASWTTGAGIDPGMGGTLTGTSISMIVEYHY